MNNPFLKNPFAERDADLAERLQPIFLEICNQLGVSYCKASQEYEILIKAYTANNRYYHNLKHIAYCLDVIDFYHNNVTPVSDKALVDFAIFYHDFYQHETGEQQSIEKALEVMTGAPLQQKTFLSRFIMATQHFSEKVKNLNNDEKLIADTDLHILSSNFYDEYRLMVRKEYLSFSEDVYTRGRTEVLNKLLAKDPLYQTDFFSRNCTVAARDNLKKELLLWANIREKS